MWVTPDSVQGAISVSSLPMGDEVLSTVSPVIQLLEGLPTGSRKATQPEAYLSRPPTSASTARAWTRSVVSKPSVNQS